VNDQDEDRPVLDDVTPLQWDPQAEASYEAAIEAINQNIGGLSALIFKERQKDRPDENRIDSLLRTQERWSRESASLRLGYAARPVDTRPKRDLLPPGGELRAT
jgi:hypothetical protein